MFSGTQWQGHELRVPTIKKLEAPPFDVASGLLLYNCGVLHSAI